MPVPKQVDDDEEQAALIEDIIESRWFRGAGADIRIKILGYLFLHRREPEGIKAITIGLDVLYRPDQKFGEIDERKLADTTRHHLEALRESLTNTI